MLLQSLDVFIGIVTTFLLLSLIASAIGEGFSTWTNLKGRVVKKLVKQLLGKADAANFMRHPAISRLRKPGLWQRTPSYIPDDVFASTLLQFLVNGHEQEGAKPIAANTIDAALRTRDASPRAGAPKAPASSGSEQPTWLPVVEGFWRDAQFDVEELKSRIAAWFNQTGDRSTGWFRRELSLYLFGIGLVTAIFLDADTLRMFEKLSTDQNLRQMYVDEATKIVAAKSGSDADVTDTTKLVCKTFDVSGDCPPDVALKRTLAEITPLVGFDLYASELSRENKCPDCWIGGVSLWFWVLKAIGLLLTAAAVSLGAPFWFDMLQKIVQIRSSVRPAISAPSGQAASADIASDAQVPIARAPIRPIAAATDALADLSHFETTRLGFSAINYAWSARLAKLGYERSKDAVASQLQVWGADGEIIEHQDTDTQCIVASTPSAAFIAFRGTEKDRLEDWLTDARFKLVQPSWDSAAGYLVHEGFNDALAAVLKQLETALELRGVFSRHTPIWITGHSLGGALAALCSLWLLRELASRPQSTTIGGLFTFGQPRVGDKACAAALDQAFANRYFRSVNHRDVVPRVPLTRTPDVLSTVKQGGPIKEYDYVHAGRVVYFDDTGQAMMDPPLWYKTLDALPVGLTADEIKKAIVSGIGDHDMGNYVRLHCAIVGGARSSAAPSVV